MSHPKCPGCYPIYQENQLAHAEEGGCLFQSSDDAVSTTTGGSVSTVMVECCICYDPINTKKNNCVTECGHQFCLKCLATTMAHNGYNCPYCRTPLVEMNDEDEDEDDEENDEGDDEEDIDEEDEDEDEDDEGVECGVEELTRKLMVNGFKMEDMVAMLMGRYRKDDTDAMIFELTDKFDAIVNLADEEAVNEDNEQRMMGKEDKPFAVDSCKNIVCEVLV